MSESASAVDHASRERTAAAIARRVGLVMAAWMALAWGVVGVFVWRLVPGGWWTLGALAALSAAPIAVVLRGYVRRVYPTTATRVLVLRPFFYAFFLLPLVAIGGIVGALAAAPWGAWLAGGRWGVLVLAALLAALALAGYLGSRRLVVKHLEVRAVGLPPAFDGLRIAQLSDLHVGPHSRRAFLQRIAREVELARPDVIAYTGDQVDDFSEDVEHFVRAFGHLRAPLGSYAIAGNHDIYAGWARVRDGMEAAGIRVLVNEAIPLERGGERVWIAGTGDPAARQMGVHDPNAPAPDLDATMARVPPGAYSVVLAHNPALWPGLAERGARLTLSGHTHHGQISIPFLKWSLASIFLEHAMGRYDRATSVLYINPGTNFWGLPLRIGAWPEVTIVTLRRD